MHEPPKGWPRIASTVFYDDAAAAIDWLCRAFGFRLRLKVEGKGGRIEHSELAFGGGLVLVASATAPPYASPRSLGGASTQSLCVCVDDVDAHCERARSMGARILEEPTTRDYGEEYWAERTYRAEDPEGHRWWFLQRLREPRTSAR